MKTIIAAFLDNVAAQQASEYLSRQDVTGTQILDYGAGGEGLISRLRSFKIPRDKADTYAELSRRGATLLVTDAPDDRARSIADDLDRLGSLDVDAAERRWRAGGWSGFDSSARRFDEEAYATERAALMRDSMPAEHAASSEIPVIEEQVRVGKREVSRGGVRIRTFIVERPVREQVELREERIDVHRERVDEPISPAALDSALTEEEFEVTASGEEAVVGKEARVVERVHVGKTAESRTETIEETERRRDVQVENLEGTRAPEPPRRR